MKEYKITPKPPEVLNDVGEEFWRTYCQYFLDRESLTADVLPSIEALSFQHQKRVDLQNELYNNNDEELLKSLNRVLTQIRMLSKQLKIYPRANEFTKADSGEGEEQKEQSPKMKLLQKKKNF